MLELLKVVALVAVILLLSKYLDETLLAWAKNRREKKRAGKQSKRSGGENK